MPQAREISASFTYQPHPSPMPSAERDAILVNPGFGKTFTDHMFVMRYDVDRGWHNGTIEARAPFQIDPACAVLHYAQEIFEGMKAYRAPDGGAALFRPDANARRFRNSAERLAMPALPEAMFVKAVHAFVKAEEVWIPQPGIGSLYLRPFMFASEAFLGVRPAAEYRFVIIGSPAGQYFKSGALSLTIWVADEFSRAGPGGTGAAKCGGNYAASLLAQADAISHGCDQVLFLDAAERQWVEELGGMNIFFVFSDGSIITPPLGQTILPGITRDSILRLTQDMGLTVREQAYSLERWREDAGSGRLVEAFACGTAAVVTPIGRVLGASTDFTVGGSAPGSITMRIRRALVKLQLGLSPDPYGWYSKIEY